MIKGGYKIVNFNGAALSGSSETLPGIYAQIVDDYDKPVMVSGVSLNGDIMDDAYASVQEKIAGDLSKSVELTVYGGIITVTEDDEVTFVLSKTTAELTAEIGDLEDLETTEKDSVVGAINELKEDIGSVFLIRTYEASCSVNAETFLVLSHTDFNIEAITGYTPIGVSGFGTGSASLVLKDVFLDNPTNTVVVRNLSDAQVNSKAYIKILYAKTSFMGV